LGAYDHGRVEPLREKAHPAIDLAQPLLPVDVLRVLGAVPLRRGLRHLAHHLRALDAHQAMQLVRQLLGACRGQIVRHGLCTRDTEEPATLSTAHRVIHRFRSLPTGPPLENPTYIVTLGAWT